MRVPRLYQPNLNAGRLILEEEEGHHAARVLRMEPGDRVSLFDGKGGLAEATIQSVERNRVIVEADAPSLHPFELAHRLILAVAMSKAHRQSYLVEKCTELGVAGFWPILCERSVTRPAEAAVDKWSRRSVEAAKQSLRVWVPLVAAPISLAEAVARRGEFDACVVASPTAESDFHSTLIQKPAGSSVLALVGPEGGWTPAEWQLFASTGILGVSLSPTVLRVETAAVALCAAAAMASCSASPS